MNQNLSVVIPCYNEENNLKRGVLEEVFDFLQKVDFKWEVIIVNDASTDNSLKICQDFAKKHNNFKVLDLPHGGKPAAVWGGIQAAKYPLVLFTDMDQSTPLKEIKKLLPFSDKYDVVIGSRGKDREGNSFIRILMSQAFLIFRRLVLLPKIIDTQCGFKMFKTEVAKKLFPNLQFFKDKSDKKGWRVSAFDVELLFMAQKWGYQIKEVPVIWKNEDTSNTKGEDNVRFKKNSEQMAKEIFRIIKNNLTGLYEK
jgi:glycosyltransferase involved in cell wall biosynthesis